MPQFLTASRGIDAPTTDLLLYKNLHKLKSTDQVIAERALATLANHLWYLTPTTVLLSLLSDLVSEDEKSAMTAKLLSLPRPNDIQYGLPTFPVLSMATQLRDLVTPKSWEFFNIVKVSTDWMALLPAQ